MRTLLVPLCGAAVLLLAGCATDAVPAPAAVDVADDEVGTILPTPPPAPGAEADGGDAAPLGSVGEDCGDALAATLVAAVDGQLDAITDGRWADALTFSTPTFREDTDPDTFAAVITEGFPVVAAAAGRDTGRCLLRTSGDQATMFVEVVDVDGTEQSLVYLFELTDDTWGIAGAVPTDPGGTPATRDDATVTT